jgi:hypothetical protein
MIVLGGASHFRVESGTVPALLKARGVRAAVLEFTGLESAESINLQWKMDETLESPIPDALRIAHENDQLGRHGVFMISEGAQWIINLEARPELASTSSIPVAN